MKLQQFLVTFQLLLQSQIYSKSKKSSHLRESLKFANFKKPSRVTKFRYTKKEYKDFRKKNENLVRIFQPFFSIL